MTTKIINITLSIVLLLLPLIIFPLSLFPETYNTPKIILLYICGLTLLICLLIKYKELKFDKTDKILLTFLLLVCISTIFSVDIGQSIFGESNRYEGLLTFFCYYLIYYCAKYYFNFSNEIINHSLILILITSVFAILQYYNIQPIADIFTSRYTSVSYASSTFGNRNFFGSFVSILLPYTMCLYLFYHKKIYLIASGLCFYSLLISLTRSAWVAFFVFSIIGIIFIIHLKNKKILKRATILLSFFVILFLVFYFTDTSAFSWKFNAIVTDLSNIIIADKNPSTEDITITNPNPSIQNVTNAIEDNSNIIENQSTNISNESENKTDTNTGSKIGSGRLLIWESAFKIIKAHPIIGCGPDTYLKELNKNFNKYLYLELYPALHSVPDKAHNEYLHICATIGIPALIIYLLFIFITLKRLIENNFIKNRPSFIVFLCLISYLVQAFFNISTIGVAPIFYFLLGFSYQLKKVKQ